jgi:GT2 family glycosyltransferase
MVVRREAIDRVGRLDESFFFFFEETDWCLSMKKNGWQVFSHPQARIYHLRGETARKNNTAARIEYWKSRYTFFRKHYSKVILAILATGLIAKLFVSLLIQLIACPFSKGARTRLGVNARLLIWHLLGCPAGWGLATRTDNGQ